MITQLSELGQRDPSNPFAKRVGTLHLLALGTWEGVSNTFSL